jgi:uncharacterized protein (DUF1778 family)
MMYNGPLAMPTKKTTKRPAAKANPSTRTKISQVRVTPDEHAALTAAARDARRSVSDFLRLAGAYCAKHRVAL